jgi:hypothetical protein
MKLMELWDGLKNRREFFTHDDFMWYISPHLWTSLTEDSGTVSVATGAGGILAIVTGATLDDEGAFATTNKPFLFAFEKPLLFEARIQLTEASTNNAEPCIGFSSAMNSADMMQDAKAGPAASFSGAILYKTAGVTTWNFRVSIGTTNQDIALREVVGDPSYHTYRIEIREGSAGTGLLEAVPYRDGLQMMPLTGSPFGPPAKIAFAPTSAAAMQCGCYLKAASANAETLNVDYVSFGQLR